MPICFFRIPAKELLEQGMDGIAPRWLLLGEDKVLTAVGWLPGLFSKGKESHKIKRRNVNIPTLCRDVTPWRYI